MENRSEGVIRKYSRRRRRKRRRGGGGEEGRLGRF
jgi:hypothetical protein